MVQFGKPQQPQAGVQISQRFNRILTELSERTRLIEERLKQTREKLQVVDETNTNRYKDLRDDISNLKNSMKELKKEIEEIKDIIRKIVKEMSNVARLSDVKVLEKYINMIDVSRLMTKEDIIEIVKEEISKLKR